MCFSSENKICSINMNNLRLANTSKITPFINIVKEGNP